MKPANITVDYSPPRGHFVGYTGARPERHRVGHLVVERTSGRAQRWRTRCGRKVARNEVGGHAVSAGWSRWSGIALCAACFRSLLASYVHSEATP